MIDAWMLDLLGLGTSFAFLGYSSWRDIVSREVPDRVWLLSYPAGLALLSVRLLVQTSLWLIILLSVASATALSLVLCYLGLWGGADGKGYICLAIINPVIPALGHMSQSVDPFFPLIVFSNSYIASLASMLYPIQRNLRTRRLDQLFEGLEEESTARKAVAFITGYRIPLHELESRPFLFPIESIDRPAARRTRRFKFDLKIDTDREKELAEIKAAMDSQISHDTIWVSPGIPFLVFVTAGLALSVLFGDIVWHAVSALMRALITAF